MRPQNRPVFADPALQEIPDEVADRASVFPRFVDGRLDYSASIDAVVVDCYVSHRQQLLVLKRRNPLAGAEQPWHVVSGFFDQVRPLGEMALVEMVEEIGAQEILSMFALAPYCSRDSRIWTVYPVAAEISSPNKIRLNEEHSDFAWIPFDKGADYLLPHVCAVWSDHHRGVAR